MQIHQEYSLKKFNTFGLNVFCKYFVETANTLELKQILSERKFKGTKKLVVGSGSNILFTKNFDGLVINLSSNNISVKSEDSNYVIISAEAGTLWHDLVLFAVNKNFGGLENLSLIPGKVGAAPIQNIGAYGQELRDVFQSLSGIFIEDLVEKEFSISECELGYRESIFKRELKNKFIITSVNLRLDKDPTLKIDYGSIKDELSKLKTNNPTIKDVSDVICKIRLSKLPDPAILGNAGSFFKNPEINKSLFQKLKNKFPDMPGYKISNELTKVPAGWLIEKCGFKGKRFGNVGVHDKQALVLVNFGDGTPQEIIDLTNKIKNEVKTNFEIDLAEEVNII